MTKEIISKNQQAELESEEILGEIKDIKGIFYDDDSGVLTVTEEMSYKRFREILYWLRMRGYGKFGDAVRGLFRVTHNGSFLKEAIPKLSSCGRLIIEGGNVFTGGHLLLPFWMEWECTINVKKGSETKSWDMFFFNFLEDTIESFIKSAMMKYIFEIYEENKCSFIYEVSAMLKKEKESLPNPFYEDIGHVLEEARQSLNNDNAFSFYGLKVKALCEKTLQPMQKLYPFKKPFSSLGLGEVKEKTEGKDTAKFYGPIFVKIGKALGKTKIEEERSEIQDNHMEASPDKAKKKIEDVDEKLELELDERGKPRVRINGKSITIEERFFVDLVYLAAYKLKRKDGAVDVRRDLRWNDEHCKHYPDDLRDKLEQGNYNKKIDRKSFIERYRNKISLGIFKADPKCIVIKENICNFVSKHRGTVEKAFENISWDLDRKKAGGKEKGFDDLESEASKNLEPTLVDLFVDKIEKQELKPMIRHIFVIANAVKILGWKFQNAAWRKEWKHLLGKCDRIYKLAGSEYDERYRTDVGLHLTV